MFIIILPERVLSDGTKVIPDKIVKKDTNNISHERINQKKFALSYIYHKENKYH